MVRQERAWVHTEPLPSGRKQMVEASWRYWTAWCGCARMARGLVEGWS